jgi:tetratricopeptide (TPR) repeat protein
MFGLFNRKKEEKEKIPPQVTPQTAAPGEDAITLQDAYGREIRIPRQDWKIRVLPGQLQQYWNNADALYQVIASALSYGCFEEILDASARLLEIDPIIERSHVIRSIILLKINNTDGAEAILKKAISRIGETGSVLTNMAKVLAARGQQSEAETTLWRALQRDPNYDNALQWWVSLYKERHGAESSDVAFSQIANIPGSWRAQLWLARSCLTRKDLTGATNRYTSVLSIIPKTSDALAMISADLGTHGFPNEVIAVIAPLYDPKTCEVRVGLNLLQAYWESKDAATGTALLEQLYSLGNPGLSGVLNRYSAQFDTLKPQTAIPATNVTPPQVMLALFDRPLWLLAAYNMAWAMQDANARAPKIVFLALTAPASNEVPTAAPHREDDLGRIARAFPLYIAESLYFRTTADAHVIIPTTDAGDLILFGGEEPDENLRNIGKGYDLIATGTIQRSGEGLRARITIRSTIDLKQCAQFEQTFALDHAGTAALTLGEEIERYLLTQPGASRQPTTAYYLVPAREHATQYLAALSQTLVLTLLRTPEQRARIWGERNILQWLLTLAISPPYNDAAQFMFLTGLAKAKRYGSTIAREFERPALTLVGDLVRGKRYAARLAPLAYAVLGRRQEFENAAAGEFALEPGYAAWCDAVAAEVLNGTPTEKITA